MDFLVDLRFFILLPLNFIFFLFLQSQGQAEKAWDQDAEVQILQYPFVFMLLFILALLSLLVFLFTPITLAVPLSVNRPVSMDSGDYSVLLALSILASFIFQPWLFMEVYMFLIIISPWFSQLWSLLLRFFNCLRHTPPSLSTTWVDQNPEPAPARVEEIEMIQVQVESNHPMQNELDLEQVVSDA